MLDHLCYHHQSKGSPPFDFSYEAKTAKQLWASKVLLPLLLALSLANLSSTFLANLANLLRRGNSLNHRLSHFSFDSLQVPHQLSNGGIRPKIV